MNKEILENMTKHNKDLSQYGCKDNKAFRLKEIDKDFRTDFFRDIDKILYSLSYIRYIDKTQVFSNSENDMISKRMTHVQLVSKIARTIGRALNLNEDLIEAASLGHDLGHVPFGHVGESILDKISLKNNEGHFAHNLQSVRTLMNIENNGNGNNISIQVLDAILCHNGEFLKGIYSPKNKTKEDFFYEYEMCYKDKDFEKSLNPMTLEGCVVRISDIIAYIGKDIEDAIRLGIINENDIPSSITKILGKNNNEIVNTIVIDIIQNSYNNNYIKLSDKVFNALKELLNFNYKHIYNKANSKEQISIYTNMFESLFNLYLNQIKENKYNEDIYSLFLNNMCEEYNKENTDARKVIDFIAGMTDDFFKYEYEKYFNKV